MNRSSQFAVLALTIGMLSLPVPDSAQSPAAGGPKLLVVIVVDQMRFDYIDRFARFWEHGLKRLRDEGAVFEHAMYPYLNTVTCAGHATIGTGAFPSTHGIIMNEWWVRSAGRRLPCTEDGSVISLAYGGTADRIGHSAHRLKIPTLADRLRAASPQSRVVTLSMKPRSTIMLAGHGGTAVTWFGDANSWSTSTAFTPKLLPEIAGYVSSHPVERERETVWTRVRSEGEYTGEDRSEFERPRPAWSSQFPHPLAGASGSAPAEFYNLWERSPYSDAYLGAMAAAQVKAFQLGQRDAVDYFAVSFSGLDYVGHDFGPDSHEVQDELIRLDRTLGQLFTELDTLVGRTRYAVGVSADHGVAKIPEAQRAAGVDAGRVVNANVRKVAEAAMAAAHGPGQYIALAEYTNVYLTDAARQRADADPTFIRPLIDAVAAMPGVLRVFPSAGLEKKTSSVDPIERAAALSHYPGESGDIVLVLKPNWIGTDTSTTTHGSMNAYDQHVPVIFWGAAFKPGRYAGPASPADLAPTLASLIKLPMPGTDGRALTDAVKK
jgi:predicted AlkP superfamily pyrophosphatase or phosphodiesterase